MAVKKNEADNAAYLKLKKDLSAGTLGQLYVLHGEEVYLRDHYLGRMKEKVVGQGNVIDVQPRMGSDDFSHFIQGRPGVLFRLGNGNPEKGCIYPSHNARFLLDEDILAIGCMAFCQYILDSQI